MSKKQTIDNLQRALSMELTATLTYEEIDKGMKVKYQSDDPYVRMLGQEHAKLVSRFIKNGMEEIHTPYELPKSPKETDK